MMRRSLLRQSCMPTSVTPTTRRFLQTERQSIPFTATIHDNQIRIAKSPQSQRSQGTPALTFDSRYLRDWCACPVCRHPDTNQRLLDTFALPRDLHAQSLTSDSKGLHVRWSDELRGIPHESVYAWDWLHAHHAPVETPFKVSYWGAEIAERPPTVDYHAIISTDAGVREWVNKIRLYGFAYVEGCPVDPIATQELIERIAFIRPTHYGGFWDFTADLASKDTAYTTLELPVHTDTTYFSDPAGLQMFHLLSHTEGTGGASILSDGFQAARVLQEQDPEAARVLSEVRITAHATGNEDAKIITSEPFSVIQRVAGSGKDDPVKIRWNNDDRGSFGPGTSQEALAAWYEAAGKFKKILDDPKLQYRAQLKPGRPVIFDNWRVLHGRTAFHGKRRLCGAYINMDDFLSRWRTLNMSKAEIAASI